MPGCKFSCRGVKITVRGAKIVPRGANFILAGAEIRIGWHSDSNRNNRGISTTDPASWPNSDF